MKYLLDTDVIIDYLRGRKSITVSLLKQGSAISIITQAELFYGAYKSNKPAENLAKIDKMLEDLGIDIIPLSMEITQIYGCLKADLEKKGARIDEFDLLISATTISSGLILATNNLGHFQRISQLKLFQNK